MWCVCVCCVVCVWCGVCVVVYTAVYLCVLCVCTRLYISVCAQGERVVLAPAGSPRPSGEEEAAGEPPITANQVKKQKVWEQVQPLLSTCPSTGAALFGGVPMAAGGHGGLRAPAIRGGQIS